MCETTLHWTVEEMQDYHLYVGVALQTVRNRTASQPP